MTATTTIGTRRQKVTAMVSPPNLSGSVAVVTGGTDGVGRAVVERLAELGATVVLTARDVAKGERVQREVERSTGNVDLHVIAVDLADLRGVRSAGRIIASRWPHIDLVVANAAHEGGGGRIETVDGYEMTFAVNHLAHAQLFRDLEEPLCTGAPGRVLVVASEAHRRARGPLDFDDLMMRRGEFRARVAYGRSKLANILYARELAFRWRGSGVIVHSAHPGAVDTPMMRRNFERPLLRPLYPVLRDHVFLTADDASRGLLRVALDPRLDIASGDYFELGSLNRPNDHALDDEAAERLWRVTDELLASAEQRSGQ